MVRNTSCGKDPNKDQHAKTNKRSTLRGVFLLTFHKACGKIHAKENTNMSEQLPNHESHEQSPLRDSCMHCEVEYELNAGNSHVVLFEQQLECSYIMCHCPNCSQFTKMFINEQTITRAALTGIPFNNKEPNADPTTYEQWCDIKGIVLAPQHELTARHEELVGKFSHGLSATLGHAPELFWDAMNSPNDFRPYPQRWT